MQVNRWPKAKAHTKRRSGVDDIAWEKLHELADVPNDVIDAKEKIIRIWILAHFPINAAPQTKVWTVDFIRRNNAWIPQIEAMLNTNPTEAVLVGALHLVGNEGVLQQLRDRGYKVEQLQQ